MIYQSCSIEQVIARILRNTRVQDTSYLYDMEEWIPEAMGMLKTDIPLVHDFTEVDISFYKGRMPCGLIGIEAIEYKGCRLHSRAGIKQMTYGASKGPQLFESTIQHEEVIPGNYMWQSDIVAVRRLPIGNHTYTLEMGYINTSVCDGKLGVHYTRYSSDERGFPMIPDNENYKEALYWYVRAKMIGSGYRDTEFTEDICMQRHEKYAGRAVNEIDYPSLDDMENRITALVRFIPPQGYWEDFYNTQAEKQY